MLKVDGILNKRSADSSLEKINDAILSQSVLGRMFNYGDLDDPDRGRAGGRQVPHAQRPERLQEGDARPEARARDRVQYSAEPPSPPCALSAGAPPARRAAARCGSDRSGEPDRSRARRRPRRPGATDARRLARGHPDAGALADLRDRGAITAEEYEQKKAELLGRL